MSKNTPSDQLSIVIKQNTYTTNISIGKIIDFSKNKAFYSGGMYNTISDNTALDTIDVISALYAFFPDIQKDLKVKDILDLKPNEFNEIISEMDKKFFSWYGEWIKQFQGAKKEEKKQPEKDE